MAPTVYANNLLLNGLRAEFNDTYSAALNRMQDSRLSLVMDLNVTATNRYHTFAYLNAPPHMTYWRRGTTVPTDAMDSVQFTVDVFEWGRRIPWLKWDRKDDQTNSLMDMAREVGRSAALLPERFFFDLLTNSTNTLPAVPNAPDGSNFFVSTTRFGDSGGNIVSGSGVTTVGMIQADYYSAIERFKAFQDGKGQPLFTDDIIDGGAVIIHAAADTEVFEMAFLQQQQAMALLDSGARNATGATSDQAASQSNLIRDAGRPVQLWGTQRLATGDWYVFLRGSPKKPTFLLDREGVVELSSMEGDDNSDRMRDTAEEYLQFERRAGAGIALPYGAIKVDN